MPQIPQAGFNQTIGTSFSAPDRSIPGDLALGKAVSDIGGTLASIVTQNAQLEEKAKAETYVTQSTLDDKKAIIDFTDKAWKIAEEDGSIQPTRTQSDGTVVKQQYSDGTYVDKPTTADEAIKIYQQKLLDSRVSNSPNSFAADGYKNEMGSFAEANYLGAVKDQKSKALNYAIKVESQSVALVSSNATEYAKQPLINNNQPSMMMFVDMSKKFQDVDNKVGTHYSKLTAESVKEKIARDSAMGYLNGTGYMLNNSTISTDIKNKRIANLKEIFNPNANSIFTKYLKSSDFAAAQSVINQREKSFRIESLRSGTEKLNNTLAEMYRTGKYDDVSLTSTMTDLYHGATPFQYGQAQAELTLAKTAVDALKTLPEVPPSMRDAYLQKALSTKLSPEILKGMPADVATWLGSDGANGKYKKNIQAAYDARSRELDKANISDSANYTFTQTSKGREALANYKQATNSVDRGTMFKKMMALAEESQTITQETPEGAKRLISKPMTIELSGRLNKAGQDFSISKNIKDFEEIENELGPSGLAELYRTAKMDKIKIPNSYVTATYFEDKETKALIVSLAGKPEIADLWKQQKGSLEVNDKEVNMEIKAALEEFTGASASNLEGMRDSAMLSNVHETGILYAKARITGALRPPNKDQVVGAADAAEEYKQLISGNLSVIKQRGGWFTSSEDESSFIVPSKFAEPVQNFLDNNMDSNSTIEKLLKDKHIPYPPEFQSPDKATDEDLQSKFHQMLKTRSRFVSTDAGLKLEYAPLPTKNNPNPPRFLPILDAAGNPVEFKFNDIIGNVNGVQQAASNSVMMKNKAYVDAIVKAKPSPILPGSSPIQEMKQTVAPGEKINPLTNKPFVKTVSAPSKPLSATEKDYIKKIKKEKNPQQLEEEGLMMGLSGSDLEDFIASNSSSSDAEILKRIDLFKRTK